MLLRSCSEFTMLETGFLASLVRQHFDSMHACMRACMHACMRACMHVCVCVYVNMYV